MTDFLLDAGSHGFIASPFDLMTTELNSLANANSATSSAGGSSGVFTQTNTVNGILAEIEFIAGGSFTPASPNYLAGWFLFSEAGSTFETTVSNTDLQRSPDFIIPLNVAAYASNNIAKSLGRVLLPAYDFKVFLMSHAGQTLPSSGNHIKCCPIAWKY